MHPGLEVKGLNAPGGRDRMDGAAKFGSSSENGQPQPVTSRMDRWRDRGEQLAILILTEHEWVESALNKPDNRAYPFCTGSPPVGTKLV